MVVFYLYIDYEVDTVFNCAKIVKYKRRKLNGTIYYVNIEEILATSLKLIGIAEISVGLLK